MCVGAGWCWGIMPHPSVEMYMMECMKWDLHHGSSIKYVLFINKVCIVYKFGNNKYENYIYLYGFGLS